MTPNDPSVQEHPRARAAVDRPQRTASRIVVLILMVLGLVLVLSFLFSREGISELQRARRRVADLESRINQLEVRNRELEAEIESLKESTYAMERIAREDLGMARDGEIIYMLPKEEEAPAPHAAVPAPAP